MKGKNVLITGGNDGIGYGMALALAHLGASVFILGRDEKKLTSAVAKLITETGNTSIDYFIADLSVQQSIRATSEIIQQKLEHLDVLINNAGGMFSRFELTEDGLEKTIATNHIGYFLLTGLLLPLMKKSPQARIINVTSRTYAAGTIDMLSFKEERDYHILKAYTQSKLANILFTLGLAERLSGSGITVNCLHPGMIRSSLGKKSYLGKLHSYGWRLMARVTGRSLEAGSRAGVYLATSSEVNQISGKYFTAFRFHNSFNIPSKKTREVPLRSNAMDKVARQVLWKRSEELAGFQYPI